MTVGVYVDEATCCEPLDTWYLTGGATPAQSVDGVNVMTPVD